MITLHNNTEYINGVVHSIFYNENQGQNSISIYCEEVRVEFDRLFDEYIITCYSKDKQDEPIVKRISSVGLTIENLYVTVYDYYYDFYNEFRLGE